MSTKLRFNNSRNSRFFATLRQRVDAYFIDNKIDRSADKPTWLKVILILITYVGLYVAIMFGQFSGITTLGLALALGVVAALMGFNVCHDAIHASLAKTTKGNKFFSSMFYLIGANPYLWHLSHNIVHHTYTNIPGHDEDIEVFPGLVRLDAEEKVTGIQRFQHYYAFAIYSLASLSWVVDKDFKKFFKEKIGQHQATHPTVEYVNLFAYKALYHIFFLVLPIVFLPFAWWQIVVGFVAMHMLEGLVIALVFQLAHVVEGTDFPVPNEANQVDEAWAEHQLRTTANFSPNSKLASYLLGGLNRQIEHHLFPKICHCHYPQISEIVKQTALDFDLPYMESQSFLAALRSHYRILRKMGKEAYIEKRFDKGYHVDKEAA